MTENGFSLVISSDISDIKAHNITQRYAVPQWLFSDPKMYDLE